MNKTVEDESTTTTTESDEVIEMKEVMNPIFFLFSINIII